MARVLMKMKMAPTTGRRFSVEARSKTVFRLLDHEAMRMYSIHATTQREVLEMVFWRDDAWLEWLIKQKELPAAQTE